MKSMILIITLFGIVCSTGCTSNEHERQIVRQEKDIQLKQEQLLLKEQQLLLKEEELRRRELALDSTQGAIDSVPLYEPEVAGNWSVKMKCTETSCEGSAIGDVKTERWEIAYDINNEVLVRAFSGKKLTRTYTGLYTKKGLQLMADDSPISVTLFLTENQKMEGLREISQAGCKIIYTLSAEKLQERK